MPTRLRRDTWFMDNTPILSCHSSNVTYSNRTAVAGHFRRCLSCKNRTLGDVIFNSPIMKCTVRAEDAFRHDTTGWKMFAKKYLNTV